MRRIWISTGTRVEREGDRPEDKLDRNTWEVRNKLVFSDRPGGCPFDLVLDPRDWNH